MHYAPKVTPSRVGLRKATQALWEQGSACAWVDAAGEGETFSSLALMPQLRARLARSRFLPISTRGKFDVHRTH